MNIMLSKPNSSWIKRIEAKKNQHPNFKSSYLHQYLTKFKSTYISMFRRLRFTHLCTWNGKKWWSNFHLPGMQCSKLGCSSFQSLQIYSSMIALKLWTRIDGWKHSNPAQSSSSINMFMHLCSSNLDQFLRTKAWFLLNNAQWTRLCKKIDELCEEISSLKWENFWREWKIFRSRIVLLSKNSYD